MYFCKCIFTRYRFFSQKISMSFIIWYRYSFPLSCNSFRVIRQLYDWALGVLVTFDCFVLMTIVSDSTFYVTLERGFTTLQPIKLVRCKAVRVNLTPVSGSRIRLWTHSSFLPVRPYLHGLGPCSHIFQTTAGRTNDQTTLHLFYGLQYCI